jgi:hypothetical protein
MGSTHMSAVHGSPSSQLSAVPREHAPARQVSGPLQVRVSLHGVPSVAVRFSGHMAPVPEQVSAMSQPPIAAGRHTVVLGAKPSAGQVVAVPLQVSATSQSPAESRQLRPAATGAQVPLDGAPAAMAQAWQSVVPPAQALLQHTPSAQNVLVHWLPAMQAEPFGSSIGIGGAVPTAAATKFRTAAL